jgi:hypothetical protein
MVGAERCPCIADAEERIRLREGGVPVRYRGFHSVEAWQRVFGPAPEPLLDWPPPRLDEGTWLVVLYGLPGRGKTGLATALFAAAQERLSRQRQAKVRGAWVDVATWITDMQAGMGRAGGEAEEFRRVRDAPLRLLDDVLAVRGGRSAERDGSPWWRERVADLLRSCEMNWRPTIMTLNLVGRETARETGAAERDTWPVGLGDRFDRSLVGRCNVALSFELTGPDRRQAGGRP